MLTDNVENVLRFNQISVPNISHHDLIFASLDFDTTKTNNDVFYRDYKALDPEIVLNKFNESDWERFYSITNPDVLIDMFNNTLNSIHEECVPLRKVRKSKNKVNPWFNSQIQIAFIDRDRAYKKWKHSADSDDFARYKILRNLSNRLVTQAKRSYYNAQFSGEMTTKDFWHRIRHTGLGKPNSNIESDFNADEINASFQRHFTSQIRTITHDPRNNNDRRFAFQPVRIFEIINAVHEVKSNAIGLDNVPIKLIKSLLPLVLAPLSHIFNNIIESCVYPQVWKLTKIIPFRKKSNVCSLNNLRPISIISAISKAFERILKNQICCFIHENNMLSSLQSGYRSGHSTKTAMLKVCDDIGVVLDRDSKVVLVLLDFSKAFDTISHSIMCHKLENFFNFSRNAVILIHSYLNNRQQAVFCNNTLSSFLPVSSGVPQGSVLGPILFSLYINDLPNVVKYCSLHLFADDVQLYLDCTKKSIEEITRLVNFDLEAIRLWSLENTLKLNATKTYGIMISRETNVEKPLLRIDNESIEFVDSANVLGFTIQNNLKWDKYVLKQCGTIYAYLRVLYANGNLLNRSTKIKLFKSFILPHFISSDFLIGSTSVHVQSRMRIALNSCIRFVFNLRRLDPVSHLQPMLLGYSFQNFIKARCCILLHKISTTKMPGCLYDKLRPFHSPRAKQFIIPTHFSSAYGKTFFVRGVVLWNSLPNYMKNQQSVSVFKKQCQEYFN
uniref:Reverse transcriptase n=1 Tax=Aedes aegypti TaxID=7159 RepID=Q4F8Q2_AEDAE|nr:reverse transcriptase [Aedes aegypti]